MIRPVRSLSGFGFVTVLLALTVAGCGPKKSMAPTGILEGDKYLFERGQELLAKRKWVQAREYFQQVVENYPQSTYRPEAKLAMGDTYIGEGNTEALILGQNEFREFLTFYPNSSRADYAQYRLGYTHYKQMLAPDRDQTATREAVAEWQLFMERYPNSTIRGEVEAKLREARDRLSGSEYRVGLFYYRVKWYPGAIDRLKSVLTQDPGYTGRDAVYYYLAESLVMVNRPAEALPYLDRLVAEFVESEYLARAGQRIAALKAAAAVPKEPGPQEGRAGPDGNWAYRR
jgi:outer membrane protein assembly factor BamD